MKKTLLAITFITLIMAVPSLCHAIAGVCSNCHTMHNSQHGSSVVQTYDGAGGLDTGVSTPIEYLLNASCIACHTGDTADGTNNFNAPIVLHITNPTTQGNGKTLAGGDFYWVANSLGADDTKGHNVVGISSVDGTLNETPPGWDASATPGAYDDAAVAGGTWDSQLTCAGTYGCHGDRSETSPFSAMQRSHHSNTDLTSTVASTADSIGNSYRFLLGIKGLEDSDWQWTESVLDHNEYFGENGSVSYGSKTTISYSCAQCHGDYHNTAGIGRTASPWLRHPTDIVVPASGEYTFYNPGDSNQYSLVAPVARGSVPDSSSNTVITGNTGSTGAILMCLSCHRAHGSPCYKLMRWEYDNSTSLATALEGCWVCHTSKD